jgi:hypothetical protein
MNFRRISITLTYKSKGTFGNLQTTVATTLQKMYNTLIGEHNAPDVFIDIWKTCNLPRQKFFAWLILHKRLNAKFLMLRKNFYVQYKECILCDIDTEETLMHLFFECCFSQSF